MSEPVTGSYVPNQENNPSTGEFRSLASTSDAKTVPQTDVAQPAATLVGGRFTIVKEHAQGGLGKVSPARDEKLKRPVALKEIRPTAAAPRNSSNASSPRRRSPASCSTPASCPFMPWKEGRTASRITPCASSRARRSPRRFGGSIRDQPQRPRRNAEDRKRLDLLCVPPRSPRLISLLWSFGISCNASSAFATPSPTPTARGCCTATSNPRTSCSATTGRRWCSTGDWRNDWLPRAGDVSPPWRIDRRRMLPMQARRVTPS